jgi:hypothetical protein
MLPTKYEIYEVTTLFSFGDNYLCLAT